VLPIVSEIARAHIYPTRPVRLTAPDLPGDVADLFARRSRAATAGFLLPQAALIACSPMRRRCD
jgi:hypothetical protein